MVYLILSLIFGVISVIGFLFPTASDRPVQNNTETSVQNTQAPPAPQTSPVFATPTTQAPTSALSSFPTMTFTNSRLRFSFVYNSGSETVVECPTLGETVDITHYMIVGAPTTAGCNQMTGISDLSVERKADINGTVIIPTYNSKKDQLMQQNPSMTVELEADTIVTGVSGKRWKTSAFDLTFIEFDGVLYVLSPKMTETNRQFQFTQN